MTEAKPTSDTIARHRQLVDVLEANYKHLQLAKADLGMLAAYKELLRVLRTLPEGDLGLLLVRPRPRSQTSSPGLSMSEEEIRIMPADKVKAIAMTAETPRRHLEQIARIRFGVTPGGVSNLRTKEALVQKLLTLTEHESTHESIVRAVEASGSAKAESKQT